MPLATQFILSVNSTSAEATTNNNSHWFSSMSYIYTQLPALSRAGLMGYFFSGPSIITGTGGTEAPVGSAPTTSARLGLIFVGWALDQPESSIRTAFAPILAQLNGTTGLDVGFATLPAQPLSEVVGKDADFVGFNVRIGSRLWDEKALTNRSGTEHVISTLAPLGLNGLFVSGPGVWAVGRDTSAANPAWRRAILHSSMVFPYPRKRRGLNTNTTVLAIGVSFPLRNATAEAAVADFLTNFQIKTLRDHIPDMGCYVNESDVDEPDYQHAFWGDHYERLLEIKRKYDPRNVFWCKVCVGAEGWEVNETTGELCKVG
jgi:Berberine and berberine like